MRFDILTIFPDFFVSPLNTGLLAKALESGLADVMVHDLRSWAPEPHRKVDDEPFGGGAGMVMTPGPVVAGVRAVSTGDARVVFLTPAGRPYTQSMARELAASDHLVLVCGRYEGIDARAVEILGAEEISIGDFVLTGGEAAALVVLETVARLIPRYMSNESSLEEESFAGGLLEYPQYTRPSVFEGLAVPEVLLSGDHGKIRTWRREQALRRTLARRPELLEAAGLGPEDRQKIDLWRSQAP